MKKVSLWQIFITFFKTGLFTFGGGYAMISILEEELITKKQWITAQDMLDMLVIAESTPGVIAVNTATSVGFRLRGFWGRGYCHARSSIAVVYNNYGAVLRYRSHCR